MILSIFNGLRITEISQPASHNFLEFYKASFIEDSFIYMIAEDCMTDMNLSSVEMH